MNRKYKRPKRTAAQRIDKLIAEGSKPISFKDGIAMFQSKRGRITAVSQNGCYNAMDLVKENGEMTECTQKKEQL